MSGHHHGGLHGVPWQDLNVRFMNDKTPPGWFIGCDLDLDKYEALCDDWKQVQSYGDTSADESKIVTALRLRIKGPARELLDENKNIRETKKNPTPVTTRDDPGPHPVTYQAGYETLWKTHFTLLRNNYGRDPQKISEKHFEEFLQYSRKRGQSIQEFISEFNRLAEKAREKGLDMGPLMIGWWFLRQGRFSDEQKRWMLAPPISNDWSKLTEIQATALKMPEALTGQAHFTDDAVMDSIFAASNDDSAQKWEESYNELWNQFDQYIYAMENEEDDDEYEDAEGYDYETYWECETTAPGSESEEAWHGSSDWDSSWEEAEAYYDYDEDGYPIYYEDEAEDYDGEEDQIDVYLADASDCNTEQDEQECQIYLQQRKLYRQQRRLRPGKGRPWRKRRFGGKNRFRRKGGGKPYRRFRRKGGGKGFGGKKGKGKGKGKPGAWLRRPKGPKRRYKSKAYQALPAFAKKKGLGKGKKGRFGKDGSDSVSSWSPYGPGKGKGN